METNLVNNSNNFNFSDRTILIAEDIDFSYMYLEAVLRRTGAKILWAQNGKEALDYVNSDPGIDIVLMDMYMPVMDGYEATSIIKQLRPELPVIAQTAFVLPNDVKKCFTSGCSGFLAKPIRKEQLLNTVAEYLDIFKGQDASEMIKKASSG